ncbi:hypothetical protein Taro_053348 [Colocasia esculenta]|uniref:Uncharacterized protein n=1 Tax=Colocasia esculenta TaxID=4460 RepID=A0A843XKQ2_COLES|nr:hypothetical protein [Colocasia esculenta]
MANEAFNDNIRQFAIELESTSTELQNDMATNRRWDASLKEEEKIVVDNLQVQETSTPLLSINAQMTTLVDALKATKDSRKIENEDFRQKLESIMTQVEGFVKSVNNLTRAKEKANDLPLDSHCQVVEKEKFEEEVQVLAKVNRRPHWVSTDLCKYWCSSSATILTPNCNIWGVRMEVYRVDRLRTWAFQPKTCSGGLIENAFDTKDAILFE